MNFSARALAMILSRLASHWVVVKWLTGCGMVSLPRNSGLTMSSGVFGKAFEGRRVVLRQGALVGHDLHVIAGDSNDIHDRFPRAVFAERARQNIGEPGAPIFELDPGFLFKRRFDRVQSKDLHGGVEDDFAAFLLCGFDRLGV